MPVTVKQMIESLQRFDENAPLEISIYQINKRYPVAYCEPNESVMVKGMFAQMQNGVHVRIEVKLPETNENYMITSLRKK
jgi:hypothetical protein